VDISTPELRKGHLLRLVLGNPHLHEIIARFL